MIAPPVTPASDLPAAAKSRAVAVVSREAASADGQAGRAAVRKAAEPVYPRSAKLRPMAADPIPALGKPAVKSTGLDVPGCVDPVCGTDADKVRHGAKEPHAQLEPMCRKLLPVELRPNGAKLALGQTPTSAKYGSYFGEPQATFSQDGSRLLFASNFDDGGESASHRVLIPQGACE